MDKELYEDLLILNRRLSDSIWNLAYKSDKSDGSNNIVKGLTPRLIIPTKESSDINKETSDRISEQEARFLFTSLLNSTNYFYSVETPTKENYNFSSERGHSRKASTDVTLYDFKESEFKKILNIELKAHNPDPIHIEKDIEKLLKEEVAGSWIHLFKNADSGTIIALFKKFEEAILNVKKKLKKLGNFEILFSICILEKGITIQKLFNISNDNNDEFFRFDYKINDGELIVTKAYDWIVYQKKEI